MSSWTQDELQALETTERIASGFSLVGTIFIFTTFVSSPSFRKPINRLVFYASWGNTLCNVATLMAESPIRAGSNSHICQFQAFLIQMFVPADALWNLAMAINVYLTLFKKYNAQQLKALEWKYHLMCYGGPFVIAFTFIFVETQSRGKIYGPAVLWCWISFEWDFLRIAVCYGPAWICILIAFGIYIRAGRLIFKKRHELRVFITPPDDDDLTYSPYRPSSFHQPNTSADLSTIPLGTVTDAAYIPPDRNSRSNNRSSDTTSRNSDDQRTPAPYKPNSALAPQQQQQQQPRKIRAAGEANRAALGYTKVASLFFVSLLVTWVPSSINRVYSLIYPSSVSVSYAYAAGLVLSLMGFWNSVIYIATTRAACKSLAVGLCQRIGRGGGGGRMVIGDGEGREGLARRRGRGRESWGDSLEGLAGERGIEREGRGFNGGFI